MPRTRYTLREDVGNPREWAFTWAIADDVTFSSECGFCGRTEIRLTYEVVRGPASLWICPLCASRHPVTAILDGHQLDIREARDQVHGLTARLKQRTCQEAIRKVQALLNDPAIDEILAYFERNLQLSPERAARLFAVLPLVSEEIDPSVFDIQTRSAAHQEEFGALEEAARAAVWPALTNVQRKRLAALGFAPAGAATRRTAGRRIGLSDELPGRRMSALRQAARLKPTQKML
jgi:hypothetical protein